MSFPFNRVFLEALRDVDFMALIMLAQASATLEQFIFEQVLTPASLCQFLRENQSAFQLYQLRHRWLFTAREASYLRRIYEKYRILHGEAFYEESVGVLGLLLAQTPREGFEKNFITPFTLSVPRFHKYGRVPRWEFFDLDDIRLEYWKTLRFSWLHRPNVDTMEFAWHPIYWFQRKMSSEYLRDPDFLFCKPYIDDLHACAAVMDISEGNLGAARGEGLLSVVERIRASKLKEIFRKACIRAILTHELTAYRPVWQTVSSDTFKNLFALPGWIDMWTKSELGWICAIGLTQYGGETVEPLLQQSFDNNREALIWLFLGAHHWTKDPQDPEGTNTPLPRTPDAVDEDGEIIHHGSCCGNMVWGFQEDFLTNTLGSLSQADRLWIMRKIVSLAPEFGVCADLGCNIFNYFVLGCGPDESDTMFSALLDSIIGSTLQYIFEYAISHAISLAEENGGLKCVALTSARKYSGRVDRKNLALYRLVSL